MAVIVPTVTSLGNGFVRYAWSGLVDGDSGAKLAAKLRDMTIQVKGTATTFAMKGSNYPDGSNSVTVEDVDATTAITAVGLYVVKEGPLLLWPELTTGAVDVIVVGRP